uniref:Galectin n=1 Tax=Mola mola TaxID=94237 RepID=A0A3Q3XJX1_MOLML
MSVTNPRQTFSNPTIPFAGTILGGLLPGEMVLIQGSVPSDADRFQIDFTCGSSVKPRADVAFHFNPRFQKPPCIVCNTLQKERWGREEILHQMPFTTGAEFEIIVLVLTDQFKVAVDGAHTLEYKHRVALQRVDTITISGKISVSAVGSQREALLLSTPDDSVPFTGELLGGLRVGRSITIRGQTNQNADRFCVNLRMSDSSDIALHLNPRLKKGVFVRNSFLSQRWGPEETSSSAFPFTAGQYFEVVILCDPQQFRVAVNGFHQLDYKHRVQELKRVTQLEVLGDVRLLNRRQFAESFTDFRHVFTCGGFENKNLSETCTVNPAVQAMRPSAALCCSSVSALHIYPHGPVLCTCSCRFLVLVQVSRVKTVGPAADQHTAMSSRFRVFPS